MSAKNDDFAARLDKLPQLNAIENELTDLMFKKNYSETALRNTRQTLLRLYNEIIRDNFTEEEIYEGCVCGRLELNWED